MVGSRNRTASSARTPSAWNRLAAWIDRACSSPIGDETGVALRIAVVDVADGDLFGASSQPCAIQSFTFQEETAARAARARSPRRRADCAAGSRSTAFRTFVRPCADRGIDAHIIGWIGGGCEMLQARRFAPAPRASA